LTKPATAAYRADLGARDQPFGRADGDWIAVATVLEHATLVDEPTRGELLREAVRLATEIVGADEVQRLAEREWQDRDRSASEAIVILADRVHSDGALNLAANIYDGLLDADASLTAVQRGRILAKRARVEWKSGRAEEAADRYRHIESLGRYSNSPELRIRAWIGFVALNQVHQNYEQVDRYSRRAARLAERTHLRRLERDARSGLMIAASLTGRPDDALVHGWAVYQLSIGDPLDEAEVLQNLGQVLFNAGFVDVARAAFASVASRELPARWILPALGGLALASAASGHDLTTEWAAREILRVDPLNVPRYPLASALTEATIALTRIDRKKTALRCREAALRLAQEYDFGELAKQLDGLETSLPSAKVSSAGVLSRRAANVARALTSMEPSQLPQHVSFAAASA
jgi:tetratricopeptide (TPR) repeat protein